jgi:hypothetical protein
VNIFDTYRVVLTRADGMQIPTTLKSREGAMDYFTGALAAHPMPKGARLRVISEKVWIESQAVKR